MESQTQFATISWLFLRYVSPTHAYLDHGRLFRKKDNREMFGALIYHVRHSFSERAYEVWAPCVYDTPQPHLYNVEDMTPQYIREEFLL